MNSNSDIKQPQSSIGLIIFLNMIFNAVFSVYVLNYQPKIGEYHILICSILGILIVLFTILGLVWCIKDLKNKNSNRKITISVMLITALMGVMWSHTALPYLKDLIGGSKTVTTDSYLVVIDTLYFLDDEGNDVNLTIPAVSANELKSKDNYEYDYENNLLKYYDKMSIDYFPESKVINSISVEN
ncbi:MAG: hypothetical protein IJC04_12135 [Oscillospiraceae bacterium]|nr:hypothetical protein [Oscillospiraceae bacterium]